MKNIQSEIENLEHAIALLEQQRQTLGDLAVNTAIDGLRQKLALLHAQSEPEQRKLLTILVAEIAEYSLPPENISAEEINAELQAMLQTIREIIINQGGMIDPKSKNPIMAFWGASGVREEDAEHAIRAGFEIQQAFMKNQVETQKLASFTIRVGINSGMALLTQINAERQEYSAAGDAVTTASRLQYSSPSRGVLISHETYRQVRGLFDVLAVPPLNVKGHSEPVQAYLIQRPKPRSFRMPSRSIQGIETRMVGREGEFSQLKRLYSQSRDFSEARLACVYGDPGLGKSRLLHEFDLWFEVLPEPVYYFKARCAQKTINQPYSLFHDLFRFRFQILHSDSPAEVRDKLITNTAPHLTPEQAYLMGQLLGFEQEDLPGATHLADNPEEYSVLARQYILDYLDGMTSLNGTLIYFEDIHWADSASLDFILETLQHLANKRLLLVSTACPLLFERRPNWGRDHRAITFIPIKPLSEENAIALTQEILQKVDYVPDSLCRRIAAAAEGNPFYIEELIKLLIAEGVIVCGSLKWTLREERIASVRIPGSLIELLQTHLDNLPYEEKKILQRASIVGRFFGENALAALQTEGGAEPQISKNLLSLLRREFIFRREQSKFAGAEEYIFKHIILQEATYDTILPKIRKNYHHLAALWLQNKGKRVHEYPQIIAEHYQRAGEISAAVEWLIHAAENAALVRVYHDAIVLLEHALSLIQPKNDPQYTQILVRLGDYYEHDGNYAAAMEKLHQGLETARENNDQRSIVQAQSILGLVLAREGCFEEGLERQNQSLKVARTLNEDALIAEGLQRMALIWELQANYENAASYYQQSLAIYQRVQHLRGMNACNAGLSRMENQKSASAPA